MRWRSHPKPTHIDAAALIRARRYGGFERLLAEYREAGFSDREIAKAMAASPALIDAIGPASAVKAPPRPRYSKK